MQSMKSVSPDVYEKTEGQTDKQTNKQTNKPTKQKDYTSPALAGAGDYKKTIRRQPSPGLATIKNDRQTNEAKRLYVASPSRGWRL